MAVTIFCKSALSRLLCARAFVLSAHPSAIASGTLESAPATIWRSQVLPSLFSSGIRHEHHSEDREEGAYRSPPSQEPGMQSCCTQRQQDCQGEAAARWNEKKSHSNTSSRASGTRLQWSHSQAGFTRMFSTSSRDLADSEAVSAPLPGSRAAERPLERDLPQESGLPREIPDLYPPTQAYLKNVASGVEKAESSPLKILTLGALAGSFIGFGAFLAMSIGGACPAIAMANPGLQKMIYGAFGLPFGLLMTMVCGADLFTGNTATVTAAVIEKKASLDQLAKSWGLSYLGNLAGATMLVGLVTATGLLATAPAPIYLATAKTSLAFSEVIFRLPVTSSHSKDMHGILMALSEAFARGILANWLVCIAVWQCNAAKSLASKAVGIWFPISAFVALGLEHSVANMFMVPMGIAVGADVTYLHFVTANLIPVTLGNIVGGAAFVATPYALAYGRLGKLLK